MGAPQRVTVEQIVSAYRETGSVWKTGKRLGIGGQSVWERLSAVGYPMQRKIWSNDELRELESLSSTCTISEISRRLGRPYAAIACKISRLGHANRFGNRANRKLQIKPVLTAEETRRHAEALVCFGGTVRGYCRSSGVGLETFVQSIQRYEPEFWSEFSKRRGLSPRTCVYCGENFHPLSGKQRTCTRKCGANMKRDKEYFGGKRRSTLGLSEGVCQLCHESRTDLSAHHMLGKENDPDNESLIALCRGCHQIVGILAARGFAGDPEAWELLIGLVTLRRLSEHHAGEKGIEAEVRISFLSAEELQAEGV